MSLVGAGGLASIGYVNFLFGILLAAWAAHSGRSGILWFVFGWVLAPIAGLVMLYLQRGDRRRATPPADVSVFTPTGRSDLLSVRKDVI